MIEEGHEEAETDRLYDVQWAAALRRDFVRARRRRRVWLVIDAILLMVTICFVAMLIKVIL